MGRLTDAPELRATNNGIPVASFRMAVGRDFERDETDFFNVTAWRQTAEFVCEYFAKGQMICVLGKLQNKQWEDKHGQKRVTAEIVAERVYFASGKSENRTESDGAANRTWEERDCSPSPFD
jgi:single-strand DNA-binding protein